jgi:hypothetical protein
MFFLNFLVISSKKKNLAKKKKNVKIKKLPKKDFPAYSF